MSRLRLRGIAASPGVAFGPAVVLGRREIRFPRRKIAEREVHDEIERLSFAVASASAQLAEAASRLGPDDTVGRSIIDVHRMMLRDDALVGETERTIAASRLNAEWALAKTIDALRKTFETIDDPYLGERVSDIEFVGQRLLQNLTGQRRRRLDDLEGPAVVIAYDLSPAETAEMLGQPIVGFATAVGSHTSHTAIMARSLEIPAVVGLGADTERIAPGETVVIDGLAGELVVEPTPREMADYEARSYEWVVQTQTLLENRDLPAISTDGVEIELHGNIEFPGEAAVALEHGATGIGLYRTEFLFVNRDGLPSEDAQYAVYRSVVETVAPHPVTLRTFDIGGDKYVSTFKLPAELNPALGLRAVRLGLRLPEVFKTQLRAMLRAAAHGDVRIMFPMISGVQELRACLALLHEAAQELERAGVEHRPRPPVGCMIEVPSAVMCADLLAREVDFFSIGTNDLIQYTLAIDRASEHVAHLYHPLHPAVLRSIEAVVRAARGAGVPVSSCGAMSEQAVNALVLLGLGLDALSVSPLALPAIKAIVRRSDLSVARAVARELLDLSTAEEVEVFAREALGQSVETRPASLDKAG